MKTWFPVPEQSHFSIYNLPYGIFSTKVRSHRIGIAIGAHIIDLGAVAKLGIFDDLNIPVSVYYQKNLNAYISLGKAITNKVRERVQTHLSKRKTPLKENPSLFVEQSEATMHLPVQVGDYTDFYSSIEHATNVGKMFRDPKNALLPNWKHIPIGYHGRASSIVVSGTPVRRPNGQTKAKTAKKPSFGPSQRLDFELEMAFIVGKGNDLGKPVTTSKAEDHIFGMVLFNDWSARDIQVWEYVPLGPFLGKSFASSISPWVVTLEALDPFRLMGPKQSPEVFPYLKYKGKRNFNINLEVGIQPKGGEETIVSQSNFQYMYWNMSQQLAHHTINGCNLKVGDMMASGTISGKTKSSYGSMLEISWAGTKPVKMKDGTERKFIQDSDTVTMRGYAEKDGMRVGFGEVTGQVLPAFKK